MVETAGGRSLCTWGSEEEGVGGGCPLGHQSMMVVVWMGAVVASCSAFFLLSHCFAPNDWLHRLHTIRVLSSVSGPP